MMRQNRQVCLQVDQIDDLANWRSVIVWGAYEELSDRPAEEGLQLIKNRLYPLKTSVFSKTLLELDTRTISQSTSAAEVIYRIKIDTYTGRFEKSP